MKFDELLGLVGDQPLFETGLLLAGDVDPNDVRRQLSRWVQSGRIRQLRRGLYTLAPPYQNAAPHPFLIANALVPGYYVTAQSALAYYSLIPEYTPRTLSVTTLHTSNRDGDINSNTWRLISFLDISWWTFLRGSRRLSPCPKRLCLTWHTLPPIQIHPTTLLSSDCKTWIDWISPACVNLQSDQENQNGGA